MLDLKEPLNVMTIVITDAWWRAGRPAAYSYIDSILHTIHVYDTLLQIILFNKRFTDIFQLKE